jgi:hypothetical protein
VQRKNRTKSAPPLVDLGGQTAIATKEGAEQSSSSVLGNAWKVLELNKGFANHQDFKPGPILTLDTAILALVGAAAMQKSDLLTESPIACLFLAVAVLFLVGSGYNVMRVLSPRLGHRASSVPFFAMKPVENEEVRTQIFFHDIKRSTEGKNEQEVVKATQNYAKALKEALSDEDELYRQIAEQIVANARVASYKSHALHDACVCLFLGLACSGGAVLTLIWTLNIHAK